MQHTTGETRRSFLSPLEDLLTSFGGGRSEVLLAAGVSMRPFAYNGVGVTCLYSIRHRNAIVVVPARQRAFGAESVLRGSARSDRGCLPREASAPRQSRVRCVGCGDAVVEILLCHHPCHRNCAVSIALLS